MCVCYRKSLYTTKNTSPYCSQQHRELQIDYFIFQAKYLGHQKFWRNKVSIDLCANLCKHLGPFADELQAGGQHAVEEAGDEVSLHGAQCGRQGVEPGDH